MDYIKKYKCLSYGRIHYCIDDIFICLPESLPEHMLLQCILLIEIFGFQDDQRTCGVGILQRFVKEDYLLYFNIDEKHCHYTLEHEHYGLVLKSENFEDVIRYMDKYYPQFRSILPQKLAINE